MPDWLFHWTHDEAFVEVLKVSIPALGSILHGMEFAGLLRLLKKL